MYCSGSGWCGGFRRNDQVARGVQRRGGLRVGKAGEKSKRGNSAEKKRAEDASRHGETTISRRVGEWRIRWNEARWMGHSASSTPIVNSPIRTGLDSAA